MCRNVVYRFVSSRLLAASDDGEACSAVKVPAHGLQFVEEQALERVQDPIPEIDDDDTIDGFQALRYPVREHDNF